jgi:hypothetical protein
VNLTDFVIRFGAEITPEVGPPFISLLISRKNEIVTINNDKFSPLEDRLVIEKFHALGYAVQKRG